MKKQTSTQKFIALINEYKKATNEINSLVDFIKSRQQYRNELSRLREDLYTIQINENNLITKLDEVKNQLVEATTDYFLSTYAIELGKKISLHKKMHELSEAVDYAEADLYLCRSRKSTTTTEINRILSRYGDCDTNLENAIREYYNAVDKYNTYGSAIDRLTEFKFEPHSTEEISRVPEFEDVITSILKAPQENDAEGEQE